MPAVMNEGQRTATTHCITGISFINVSSTKRPERRFPPSRNPYLTILSRLPQLFSCAEACASLQMAKVKNPRTFYRTLTNLPVFLNPSMENSAGIFIMGGHAILIPSAID